MTEPATLLRLDTVVALRGRSRAQNYVDIRKGTMTPPVRLGAKLSAWPASEIDALIRAEISGASREDLQSLVRKLVDARKKGASA